MKKLLTRKRSFVLSIKQLDYLEKEAARIGISVSDLVRRIIDEFRDGNVIAYSRSKLKEK